LEKNSAIGIETWGGGSRKQKAKSSKLSLVTQISVITETKSLDITSLSIRELEDILVVANNHTKLLVDVPISRFKKPYLLILSELFPKVSLDKLSVSALKELLGAFNEK
jgi:hypothetical protein